MDYKDLQEKIRALPELEAGDRFTWSFRRRNLRDHILRADQEEMEKFLTWATVQECMYVGAAPYLVKEIPRIPPHLFPPLQEPRLGAPSPYHLGLSGNWIHQLYYLARFLEITGLEKNDLQNLEKIAEFGPGYGAMATILVQLGFLGQWTSYDFPEFHALQEYYLSHTTPDLARYYKNPVCASPGIDLLLAITSLSEWEDIEARHTFVETIQARYLLIVFQELFYQMDNFSTFLDFIKHHANYRWTLEASPGIAGHWLLVGVRL